MTLGQLMASHRGEWQGDRAVIQDHGGYYWIVAERRAGVEVVTKDGERFGLGGRAKLHEAESPAAASLEAALSGMGTEAPKTTRGRHGSAKLTARDLDLDG